MQNINDIFRRVFVFSHSRDAKFHGWRFVLMQFSEVNRRLRLLWPNGYDDVVHRNRWEFSGRQTGEPRATTHIGHELVMMMMTVWAFSVCSWVVGAVAAGKVRRVKFNVLRKRVGEFLCSGCCCCRWCMFVRTDTEWVEEKGCEMGGKTMSNNFPRRDEPWRRITAANGWLVGRFFVDKTGHWIGTWVASVAWCWRYAILFQGERSHFVGELSVNLWPSWRSEDICRNRNQECE